MPSATRLEICASPLLLVAGIAGSGVTSFISRLACIATGHFRQWNENSKNIFRVPNNWALDALSILASDGFFHLWGAALAAHAAALERIGTPAVSVEVGVSLTAFILPQATLSSLAFALARTIAVFKLADDVHSSSNSKVGGRMRDFINDTSITDVVCDLYDNSDDGSLLSLANVLM